MNKKTRKELKDLSKEQQKSMLKQLQKDYKQIDRCPTPVEKSFRYGAYTIRNLLRMLVSLAILFLIIGFGVFIIRLILRIF